MLILYALLKSNMPFKTKNNCVLCFVIVFLSSSNPMVLILMENVFLHVEETITISDSKSFF